MSLAQIVTRRAAADNSAKTSALSGASTDRGAEAGIATAGPAIAVIVAAGLALRIYCAAGPLWVDEIWSIINLDPIKRFWGILWLSHDNNHFLNSLWLYAVGSSDNPLILRGLSILTGALAIPMVARIASRTGPAAAVCGSALIAFSFFFVSYSAEARGYAASALALLVAYDSLERAIDRPASRARFVLAIAAGLGAFAHLAMLPAVALFGLICFGELWRRDGRLSQAVAASLRLFWPSAVAIAPAIACVIVGYVAMSGFEIGNVRPFSLGHALGGMAEMVVATFGLPAGSPIVLGLVILGAPLVVLAALGSGAIDPRRRVTYGVILLVLPLVVLAAHPPNSHIPRYYLICALFAILLASDLFDAAWRRGGWRRLTGVALLIAAALGNGAALLKTLADERSSWPQALEFIAGASEVVAASNFDYGIGKFVEYFDRKHERGVELVGQEALCARRPQWFIVDLDQTDGPTPRIETAGKDCVLHFDYVATYGVAGLSQTSWALYRRDDQAAPPP
jgi:hypothetical protein